MSILCCFDFSKSATALIKMLAISQRKFFEKNFVYQLRYFHVIIFNMKQENLKNFCSLCNSCCHQLGCTRPTNNANDSENIHSTDGDHGYAVPNAASSLQEDMQTSQQYTLAPCQVRTSNSILFNRNFNFCTNQYSEEYLSKARDDFRLSSYGILI